MCMLDPHNTIMVATFGLRLRRVSGFCACWIYILYFLVLVPRSRSSFLVPEADALSKKANRQNAVQRVCVGVCVCACVCVFTFAGRGVHPSGWILRTHNPDQQKRCRRGLLRELNPGPLAPEARIMPLDQAASCICDQNIDPKKELQVFYSACATSGGLRAREPEGLANFVLRSQIEMHLAMFLLVLSFLCLSF